MTNHTFPVFSEQHQVGLTLDKAMHEAAWLNHPESLKLLEICIELENMPEAKHYIDQIQCHADYSPTWILHVSKLYFRVHRYQKALETLQALPELPESDKKYNKTD
ncbi:MAG TPA: hypothetical protein ENJ32_09955 [Crenotrichaceae bacterium]|nr:hypothetical protein [Crenotrichaceae bacterium]